MRPSNLLSLSFFVELLFEVGSVQESHSAGYALAFLRGRIHLSTRLPLAYGGGGRSAVFVVVFCHFGTAKYRYVVSIYEFPARLRGSRFARAPLTSKQPTTNRTSTGLASRSSHPLHHL